MPPETSNYGIDTSVFVRLLTGHPEADFTKTAKALERLFAEDAAAQLFVSNQVIGEAYITLQHFYEISKADARKAMLALFSAGVVQPLNGHAVIEILEKTTGAGLLDRLIAQEYTARNFEVLTNDKRMARLDGCQLLK